MRLTVIVLMSVLLLFVTGAVPAEAGVISPELASVLAGASADEEIPVVVVLKGGIDARGFTQRDRRIRRRAIIRALKDRFEQNSTRSKIRDGFRTALGDTKGSNRKLRPLWIINGLALSATPARIQAMAENPRVRVIQTDEPIPLTTLQAADGSQPEWNLLAVGAPELWNLGYAGQGVVVATLDSGVDADHPDLLSRWRGGANSWFDANDPDFDPVVDNTPYDPDGHGTAVMGIIVGGDNSGTAIGVAPGASWIAAKIFDAGGIALESEIHAAFQWMLDPDGDPETDDAPDVVNNSWGFDQNPGECIETPEGISFRTDVQVLRQAGIAVVFSAGGSGPGPNTSVSPANYPESFAVGAVDETQAVADFSSRGPSACDGAIFPDVTAPGDRTTLPFGIKTADLYFGFGNPYVYLAGTSLAAPHVTGAMALLMSAFPGLSADEIESALKASTVDLGDAGPDNDSGYGMIDIPGAYRALGGSDAVTISSVVYNSASKSLTIVAVSSDQPAVTLTASGYGNLNWKSWLNFYRATFTGVLRRPDSVTVNSSGGGAATYDFPVVDAVAIQNVAHNAGTGSLTVVATSSDQPAVALTASGYGNLNWKSWLNFYRATFTGVLSRPGSVTVNSSGGGSATYDLPATDTVVIQSAVYNASNDSLTVVATSSSQPNVHLTGQGFGPLSWKSWLNFYRNTYYSVTTPPAQITVNSSGGGTDTRAVATP